MPNAMINIDLSQAELRVMALLSGDAWMQAALQEGTGDFFSNHLMPVAFPSKMSQYGSMDAYNEADPVQFKEDRTACKGIQYGLAFGRQARAIAIAVNITVEEAELIISNYFATAPNFAQWRIDVMNAAVNPAERDFLVNPFGRRFQSEVITSRNFANVQREALSFLPQSTSSDICLSTAVRIHKELKSYGYNIFNMVHDAIMIEGPEEGAHDIGQFVGRELKITGQAVFGTAVPFLSDYSVGKSWADMS